MWSPPVGFLWGALTERRHVPACTANELRLQGQGAATFSIKGQTINILSLTSHIWSLPQILLFILCVFWFVVNNPLKMKTIQTIVSSQATVEESQTRFDPQVAICQPLNQTEREKVCLVPQISADRKQQRHLLGCKGKQSPCSYGEGNMSSIPRKQNWSLIEYQSRSRCRGPGQIPEGLVLQFRVTLDSDCHLPSTAPTSLNGVTMPSSPLNASAWGAITYLSNGQVTRLHGATPAPKETVLRVTSV